MSFVTAALIGGGAAILGGAIAGRGASKAAGVQAEAADRASDVQRQMFERNVELNAPFREAGITALNKLTPLATNYTPFGMDQFRADPGYAFRMSEGMKGLERSAAARGGLLSGGMLKGIQRFGQDLGSQEYQNAFNRYQTERNAQLNPLQSLAGVGQTTSQQLGAAGTQMAGNVGNLMTGGAAARASGYVGGANALTGALSGATNMYMQGQVMNRLLPQQSGGGGFGGGFGGGGYMPNSPYNFSGMSEFG
jgi:hypothetical protein